MGKIILYIAASLDGYVARDTGDVDWFPTSDSGYDEFYKSIGSLWNYSHYSQYVSKKKPGPKAPILAKESIKTMGISY